MRIRFPRKRPLRSGLSGLWLSLALTASAMAQAQVRAGPPAKIDFSSALAIDAKTAQAVDQVLREQHEKRAALGIDRQTVRAKEETLHAETEQKLAQLLNSEQLEKLHRLMPKPGASPPSPPHD